MQAIAKLISLILISAAVTACSSPVRTVPLTVQSDPLGAYVMFQMQADRQDDRNYDWIFLGNTPLKIRRSMTKDQLEDADAFVIRVMKDGYHEQKKSYTGKQLVDEAKSKGTVFWSPRLVPSQ